MTTIQPDRNTRRHKLAVELEITPPESCSCGVDSVEGEIVDVQQVRVDDKHHTELTVASSEACCPEQEHGCVIHRTTTIDPGCPFQAFYDEGWIPRITDIADDTIRVRVYLPNREALSAVIDVLRRATAEFQVRRLTRIDHDEIGNDTDRITVDLGGLTEKQRVAAVKAVEAGYYDQPREISFGTLADELGISKSLLSQRLNSIEAKFMKAAFSEGTCNGISSA